MNLTLFADAETQADIEFEPDNVKWRESTQQFTFWKTGLAAPLDRVFVKRWKSPATGDALLSKMIGTRVPGTPAVLGRKQSGNEYFYFFEWLPDSAQNVAELVSEGLVEVVARDSTVQRIVNLSCKTFSRLNELDVLYCDVRLDNILYDLASVPPTVSIIDIDSCLPLEMLDRLFDERKGSVLRETDIPFWAFFNTYCLLEPGSTIGRRALEIQKTLVFSLAAVLARTVALAKLGNERAAQELLANPGRLSQQPLWTSLQQKDKNGYSTYFQLTKANDSTYLAWCDLFERLSSLQPVEWENLRESLIDLLEEIEAGSLEAREFSPAAAVAVPKRGLPGVGRLIAVAAVIIAFVIFLAFVGKMAMGAH